MFLRANRFVLPLLLISLASLAFAVFVIPAPPATGQVGVPYSFTFNATGTGGTPPFSFSYTGNLPPGVTLNGNTGVLSGTPTTAGAYTFSLSAADSSNTPLPVIGGSEVSRYTKGMAKAVIYGPYGYTITISPAAAAQGAPISPIALALLMLGLAAAGIFRMRQALQA